MRDKIGYKNSNNLAVYELRIKIESLGCGFKYE